MSWFYSSTWFGVNNWPTLRYPHSLFFEFTFFKNSVTSKTLYIRPIKNKGVTNPFQFFRSLLEIYTDEKLFDAILKSKVQLVEDFGGGSWYADRGWSPFDTRAGNVPIFSLNFKNVF